MRNFTLLLMTIIGFQSCESNKLKGVDYYKTGTFKTVLTDSDISSLAQRNDSIQVETYEGKRDTFYISWKSDFEYILLKKNPKTALDSTPFHVKITRFDGNSYNFKAYYKGSNFKQTGTATKID